MKNNIFLFINLSINCGWNSGINHGIAYLVPVIKKHSYEVHLYNIRHEIPVHTFIHHIKTINPSIIGYSLTSHQVKYLTMYSQAAARVHPGFLQIAGGAGARVDPEGILRKSSIHGVCIGEGELPLEDLLARIADQKNMYDAEGFYWKRGNAIKKNKSLPYISDLSGLQFPDYSIFKKKTMTWEQTLHIILSRGCPYNCSYCCNHVFKSTYSANSKIADSTPYYRLPPVGYAIDYLTFMIQRYPGTKYIAFADDTLLVHADWFMEFARAYKRTIHLPYKLCARVEHIHPRITALLAQTGCMTVALGIESGNESLRKYVLQRNHSNDVLIEKSLMIKKAGLQLRVFTMVGFPFETREEMEDTYTLNRRIAPHGGHCFFFYPYKGTDLYALCKEHSLLKSEDEMINITHYMQEPSIRMSPEQERDCRHYQKKISDYLALCYSMQKSWIKPAIFA